MPAKGFTKAPFKKDPEDEGRAATLHNVKITHQGIDSWQSVLLFCADVCQKSMAMARLFHSKLHNGGQSFLVVCGSFLLH